MAVALACAGGGLMPPPAAAETSEAVYARGVRYFTRWHELRFGAPAHLPLSVNVIHTFVREHLDGLEPGIGATLKKEGLRRAPEKPSAVATVRTWLASISVAQASAGFTESIVTSPIKLLLRRHARIQAHGHRRARTRPITENIVVKLIATCDSGSLIDLRDKAILLVAFDSGGRRSSEIRDLRVENLVPQEGGFLWIMPRSKTDAGTVRDVHTISGRAAYALREWIGAANIVAGPVFRGTRGRSLRRGRLSRSALHEIVKRRLRKAGLCEGGLSPHSLRFGYVTDAANRGVPIAQIMRRTGHRSIGMVMHYALRGKNS